MNDELKYLVDLINMVRDEEDDANKRRLWSLIAILAKKQIGELSQLDAVSILSEIHELNFEQLIKIQAKNFYSDFTFNDLHSQLVSDFIQMEHSRRRDDFDNFSLAMYQQIENIINHIFINTDIWEKFTDNMFLQFYSRKDSVNQEIKRWGKPIGYFIFYCNRNENLTDQITKHINRNKFDIEFLPRFKFIFYFICLNGTVGNLEEWNQLINIGTKIYFSRNRNHRGPIRDNKQIEKQNEIYKSKYKYYLLFHGFLADFIQKINAYYLCTNTNNDTVIG